MRLSLLPIVLAFWITGKGVCLAGAAPPQTEQAKEVKNPFADDPGAIQLGGSRFRSGCAPCHGIDGRGGGRGPDLTLGHFTRGDSDAALFRTITQGVPGTEMPPSTRNDDEIWVIIAFLRSLSAGSAEPIPGNPAAGEQIFSERNCSLCHMVNGRGGRWGPELSRVGTSRSVRFLAEKIRDPSKQINRGYETVTVVAKDGRRITGVRKNEDTFSIQLMDQQERLHFYLKKDLREVVPEPKSAMPSFGPDLLDEKRLEDLVAYLAGLRGR